VGVKRKGALLALAGKGSKATLSSQSVARAREAKQASLTKSEGSLTQSEGLCLLLLGRRRITRNKLKAEKLKI
jgi:hypothetical protein